MKRKFVITAVLAIVAAIGVQAQSVENISKIRQAQDMAITRMVDSLSNTNLSTRTIACEVKTLADGLILMQAAESRAYKLANERDIAAQAMTTGAMTRSLAEAKEFGVSRSLRNNIESEWRHARTLEAADKAVAKIQAATGERALVIADRGSFRRMLPEWMGGTSSYANYRVPQPLEQPDALTAKVGQLEQRVLTLQATIAPPTIIK